MAVKIADTKKMTREEWLALRKSSIGGSDAGAIIGMNQYSSALTVYADKKGLVKDKETSEAMRLGTDLEAYVAERFSEKTGKKVRNDFYMYADDEYRFLTANIDRRVVGENAGLECKTMGSFSNYDIEGGECPAHYYAQVQHYMMVMGFDRVYLAILVLQKGLYVIPVERNESFIADMRAREIDFWTNFVEANRMPAPDGSDAAGQTLKEIYPASKAGITAHVEGLDAMIADYKALADMEKHYKERKQEVQERICQSMGDAESAAGLEWSCTWKSQADNRFDSKKFKADHPDLYDKYVKQGTKRVFRTKSIA